MNQALYHVSPSAQRSNIQGGLAEGFFAWTDISEAKSYGQEMAELDIVSYDLWEVTATEEVSPDENMPGSSAVWHPGAANGEAIASFEPGGWMWEEL